MVDYGATEEHVFDEFIDIRGFVAARNGPVKWELS